jgi:hypothetical protein
MMVRASARHAPDRGAAAPAEEAEARTAAERLRQIGLGNGDEAGANPDPIEPLRARVEGLDALSLREAQGMLQEMESDVEGRLGIGRLRDDDDGPVQHGRALRALEQQRADESVAVPRAPAR